MPSIKSVAIKAQIKLIKPILKKLSIEQERKAQDAIGELGSKSLADKVHYTPVFFDKFEAEWALPIDEKNDAI